MELKESLYTSVSLVTPMTPTGDAAVTHHQMTNQKKRHNNTNISGADKSAPDGITQTLPKRTKGKIPDSLTVRRTKEKLDDKTVINLLVHTYFEDSYDLWLNWWAPLLPEQNPMLPYGMNSQARLRVSVEDRSETLFGPVLKLATTP